MDFCQVLPISSSSWAELSFIFTFHPPTAARQVRTISAHADGGPPSRVCARKTLCLAPHRRERKFYGAESAESPSNISPNTSEVISEVLEP